MKVGMDTVYSIIAILFELFLIENIHCLLFVFALINLNYIFAIN